MWSETSDIAIAQSRPSSIHAANLTLVPFHARDGNRAVESTQHLLEANGLYAAAVQPPSSAGDKAGAVSYALHVKEGKRAKYSAPTIEGNPMLSDDAILRITGWRLHHSLVAESPQRAHARAQNLPREIRKQDRLLARVRLKNLDSRL